MNTEEHDAPCALDVPVTHSLGYCMAGQHELLPERLTAQQMEAATAVVAHPLLWCSSTTVHLSWGP